ncbi:MAG: methylenetetrahydrofolate reductase [NAD(P)H] [Lachnospiraceae bacterium]|nr:methylenetetrahydrofolate reductase [NAD(P)H] [Lachnospiraceae bacterium]
MARKILGKNETLSFEVFPPKKDGEFEAAFSVIDKLGELNPDFISVTYGAGGSRSKKTIEIAAYIQNTLNIDAIAHMTCVGCKKEQLLEVYDSLRAANVSHVLALRGDRPKDMTDEQYEARDFAHASDMMKFLKENTDIHFGGACYPEKHYECFSMETDLNNLKLKQEAGAEFLISQLFFDNDYFYSFRERAEKKGIDLPIAAGIMPITTPRQIGTTVSLSGSSIPKELADIIAKYGDNADDIKKAGTDYAVRQIMDLKANGVEHIHIYCMNRPKTTSEIVNAVRGK